MPISLSGSLNLSGSLTTTGTITATTLVVETITSSISSITGSTNFGSLAANTHTFTGSLLISGSNVLIGTPTSNGFRFKVSNNGAEEWALNPGDSTNVNNHVNYNRNTSAYIGANYLAATHSFLNGNVGIGTSSPARLLDVSSGGDTYLRVAGNRGNNDDLHVANVEFYNSNSTRIIAEVRAITGTGGTQSNSGQLAFYTNNAGTYAERMRILSAGGVLIPSDVSGTSGYRINYTSADAGSRSWKIGNDAAAYGDFYIAQSTTQSGSTYATKFIISPSGNVGIGTTTVNDKFVVSALANTWAGVFYNGTTANQSFGIQILAGTSASDTAFRILNGAQDTTYFKVRGDGWLISATTYNNTSGVSANLGIDSAGNIFRATSSSKYKKDIKPYDKGLDTVLLMNPIYYKSKSEFDGGKQFAGFIAEEINTLCLNEFVQYNDENNEPEGLNYGNMTALLVKAIQELTARVQYLENK